MVKRRLCIVFNVLSIFVGLHLATDWNGNQLRDVPERIAIGALFPSGNIQLQTVFKQLIYQHNSNVSHRFMVETTTEVVDHNDPARVVGQLQCLHFNRGVYAFLLAPSFGTAAYQSALSFSNTYRVPFVGLPIFSLRHYVHEKTGSHNEFYGLNLEPNYWPAIVSVFKWYSWHKIIYLYDSDEGIFNLQELLKQAHRSDHSLALSVVKRVTNAGDGYKLLKSLHKADRGLKHVILNCNMHIAKAIITYQVQDTAMEATSFHYLFTNLMLGDSLNKEIPSELNVVNITGFGLPIDKAELSKLEYDYQDNSILLEEALTYDGTKILLEAFDLIVLSQINVSKLYETENSVFSGNHTKKTIDSTCLTLKPFKFGEVILNHLKIAKTQGITGSVEFHSNGLRKNYTINIYENNNKNEFQTVASWSDIKGMTVAKTNRFRSEDKSLSNRNLTYIVTSILEEPFLMKIKTSDRLTLYNSNERYEGFVKDFADLLAKELNFRYEIRIVNDSKYGSNKELSGWSGMIGELVRNEVDMAIAPLTINAARQKVIDFTQPFMTTGISVLLKKPENGDSKFLSFLRPLSKELWICIIAALFTVTIILYITSRLSYIRTEEINSKATFCSSLCYSFSVLMYQVAGIFPQTLSTRIASSVWWFFVFITVTSYLANLTAQSVANRMQLTIFNVFGRSDLIDDQSDYYDKMLFPIASLEDLSKQERIEYGILKQSSTEAFFMQSKQAAIRKMWKKMNETKHVFVNSYKEGIKKVRQSDGQYAFILESAMNDYVNLREPCDTLKLGKHFHNIGYGIGIPLGSPLREKLNNAILSLRENGELEELQKKWWDERQQCSSFKKFQFLNDDYAKLTHMAGGFLILFVGLSIALIVGLFEYLCKSRKEDSYVITDQEELNEVRGSQVQSSDK